MLPAQNPQSEAATTRSTPAVRYEPLNGAPVAGPRLGRLHTPHGVVDLPAFMPVGTQGAVKGVEAERLAQTGAQMVLGNTYHLAIRPGERVVAELGGLHRFAAWPGAMLTDSGGFQVFSLADKMKLDERGARFRSHVNGDLVDLTPERSVEIQHALGADVMMALDHVVALPCPRETVVEAMRRSIRWAERCREHADKIGASATQSLFGIVQGGLDAELRVECAEELVKIGFAGYAIGGLSVGEPPEEMYRTIEATTPSLPAERPRYLMGVGAPTDLLEAVDRGVDMFDCVMPTRNGRNGLAFVPEGTLRLKNSRFQTDDTPLEQGCPCPACRQYSRGCLRHLLAAGEMLGPMMVTIHNLTYYQRLMADIRLAIAEGRFAELKAARLAAWR
ncbi:Queuine tRNA-ribosyltransferase [Pseudobythopirellula maris]|uniref:Queuine tRNA-ribosyltransferase n=1 Tax=Pseudobythopirellula maris TaxID=2527991 RepID=A0A5C5ZGE9_9BACT|nr:tRNA guanosine(34) transglycosylase Tgt [Pseudobythopirellula maris]TWT86185.1 Queuine tRNA-ribosyltransferase [Pseudobythopirellula maris]